MKLADYIYYCIYRFVLRTPTRSYADAWPIAFLALTLWTHLLTVYFIISRILGKPMAASLQLKEIGIVSMVLSMVLFFWHYVIGGNGVRVVASFEELGNENKYARTGMIIFAETLFLPLLAVGIMIYWRKLIQ